MKMPNFGAAARGARRTAHDRVQLAANGRRGPGALGALLTAALGAAAGSVIAFLLDPARGRARRARLVDQGGAALRRVARSAQHAARRARADVEGRVAAVRAGQAASIAPTDDATLTDRVKSVAFRGDDAPKQTVSVNVERGVVVLRGEVPDEEARRRLIADVEAVEGVWSVRDMLHLPGEEPVGAGSAGEGAQA